METKEKVSVKERIITFLKGLWIGGSLSVPGVSGGSMAMILGIYDKMIFSLNSLFKPNKDKKINKLENFLLCGGWRRFDRTFHLV